MLALLAIGSGLSNILFSARVINSKSCINHNMTTVTSSPALTASTVSEIDPEIATAIAAERQRQENHIELIASENFTYPAVMEAQGSVLTNKYA